jgi:hypothetical protein
MRQKGRLRRALATPAMEHPNSGEVLPMATAVESANRPLPWLGLLDKGVEEVEGMVVAPWT